MTHHALIATETGWICTACLKTWTETAEMIMGEDCPQASAFYTVTASLKLPTSHTSHTGWLTFYDYQPYDNADAKGTRLLRNAGYEEEL